MSTTSAIAVSAPRVRRPRRRGGTVPSRTSDTLIANMSCARSTPPPTRPPLDALHLRLATGTAHTAWGRDTRSMLPTSYRISLCILSIVVDSFDVYLAAERCCGGVLRDQGSPRWPTRPPLRSSSPPGDPVQVLLRLFPALQNASPHTQSCRLSDCSIQNPPALGRRHRSGIGRAHSRNLLRERWSAPTHLRMVLGALLQKVNRDTRSSASSAPRTVNGGYRCPSRSPAPTPGKDAKRGKLLSSANPSPPGTVHCLRQLRMAGDLAGPVLPT